MCLARSSPPCLCASSGSACPWVQRPPTEHAALLACTQIRALMDKKENIRNMCVIAHVDHGEQPTVPMPVEKGGPVVYAPPVVQSSSPVPPPTGCAAVAPASPPIPARALTAWCSRTCCPAQASPRSPTPWWLLPVSWRWKK